MGSQPQQSCWRQRWLLLHRIKVLSLRNNLDPPIIVLKLWRITQNPPPGDDRLRRWLRGRIWSDPVLQRSVNRFLRRSDHQSDALRLGNRWSRKCCQDGDNIILKTHEGIAYDLTFVKMVTITLNDRERRVPGRQRRSTHGEGGQRRPAFSRRRRQLGIWLCCWGAAGGLCWGHLYFLKVYQGLCIFQVAKLRTWVDATIAANGGFGSTCDA